MTNVPLTDNQRVILNAASRSASLVAWPLPKRPKLSAGSAGVLVSGLIKRGLLEKRPAMGADPVWKEESGKRFTLVISRAGLAACGITTAEEPAHKDAVAANKSVTASVSQDEPRMPRAGSKLAMLVELLECEAGATIAEMAYATGWQAHSVRGTISGALQKRFGLQIASEKVEGQGRVYRLRS